MQFLGLILAAIAAAPSGRVGDQPPPTQKVDGIGGFFFRAKDPEKLSQWYRDHLGIDPAPKSYDVQPWSQKEGITVFGPFDGDTEYFGNPEKQWMINFRVPDLDAMVAQLRSAGIGVEYEGDVWPNGRFARLVDPEGNPIQLWQPMTPEQVETYGKK